MTENKEPDENQEAMDEIPPTAEGALSAAEEAVTGDDTAELLKRLNEAEARAREFEDRYLRAVAELDNFRKRMAREKQDLLRYAAAEVIESLLPALDNLKIGLKAAEQHPEARDVAFGFEMVGKQILGALEENGLKELLPDGEPFDPHYHDSVSTQPSALVPEGHVLETIRAGYVLNDRLLRAAMVVVSKGEAETPTTDGSEPRDEPAEKGEREA